VRLSGAALGVSGVGEQSFAADGRRFGHILDPRTGWPVAGRAYAAVVAPTAALADALATAFFVGGRAVAEQYVNDHPEVSALVMDMDSPAASGQGQRQTQAKRRIPPNRDQHMAVIGSTSVWSFPRAR
jgi:thiamine biosynthesis lipoprotein